MLTGWIRRHAQARRWMPQTFRTKLSAIVVWQYRQERWYGSLVWILKPQISMCINASFPAMHWNFPSGLACWCKDGIDWQVGIHKLGRGNIPGSEGRRSGSNHTPLRHPWLPSHRNSLRCWTQPGVETLATNRALHGVIPCPTSTKIHRQLFC